MENGFTECIIIVDGIMWVDSEGNEVFDVKEAEALAADLRDKRGYTDVRLEF